MPDGGEKVTIARASCCGYTDSSAGITWAQLDGPSPTTSSVYPSTMLPGLLIVTPTCAWPPGSTATRSLSRRITGSVTASA